MAPNPRLQRTRSALLRSPLSRKPLDVTKLYFGLVVLSTLAFLGSSSRSATTGSRLRVFFPRLELAKADGERIQYLELKMTCGRFRRVSVSDDWSLQVVSPVSEQTTLRAEAGHGATTLWELGELDGGITVSVQDASCFDLRATVSSTARSFEFDRSKLVLKP